MVIKLTRMFSYNTFCYKNNTILNRHYRFIMTDLWRKKYNSYWLSRALVPRKFHTKLYKNWGRPVIILNRTFKKNKNAF